MRLPRRLEVEVLALAAAHGTVRQLATGKGADQHPLGIGQRRAAGGAHLRGRSRTRGVPQLLAQHRRIDPQAMRNLVGQLVAHNAAGHSLNVRQQVVQRLHFPLRSAGGELRPRALDEVVEIFLRVRQRLAVSRRSLAPDVEIGIEAGSRA